MQKGLFTAKKVILIRKIVTYLYVLLFTVPCESGNYWKCDVSSCVACPQGFYQPQWGQTSCWPCPFNTTTDFEGASSPTECKREHQTNSIACFLFRRLIRIHFQTFLRNLFKVFENQSKKSHFAILRAERAKSTFNFII